MVRNNSLERIISFIACLVIGSIVGVFATLTHGSYKLNTMFETEIGLLTTSPSQVRSRKLITLRIRDYRPASNPHVFDTEADGRYVFEDRVLDLHKTALILIDVWEEYPNDGWFARTRTHQEAYLVPLLALARKHNMMIIHCPHEGTIASSCAPLAGELVVNRDEGIKTNYELVKYLKANNIENLLYAGYASNYCLLTRPTGIIPVQRFGFMVYLLRDCVLAIEAPDTYDQQLMYKASIHLVENMSGCYTTTLGDLERALEDLGRT